VPTDKGDGLKLRDLKYILSGMKSNAPDKVLIRLDWKRERAYRVGLLLAKFGAILSLLAAGVSGIYLQPIVVAADMLLVLGCLLTIRLTKRRLERRTFVWKPFYFAYWLAMTTTLLATGGIASPFVGVFFSLLFIGGVVIQDSFQASSVFGFTILNIIAWWVIDFYAPVFSPAHQSTLFIFAMNVICLGAIGLCVYGFLKTEQDLAEEFTARYRELETTKNNLFREETANAGKSAFLANISHEFRTPLGAILGYVELLQSGDHGPVETVEFLSIIHRNGYQLSKLVDDLLDLSKAEADRLEVEKHEFELPETLRQVQESVRIAAEKKGLRLGVNYHGPVPRKIRTDSVRLKQILMNLIGNAIKFTQVGSVDVDVSYLSAKDQLHFRISDTGRGLTASESEKLFKPFSQADVSTARKYGGTGLGLSLSKRLAELMGGNVVLEKSEPNVGSTFTLILPAGYNPGESFVEFREKLPERPTSFSTDNALRPSRSSVSARTKELPRLKGLNILIVDDIEDNRVLAQRYIQGAGGTVEIATDGNQGIQKALDGDFDLVLMDIQMPGISGLDATKQLRARHFDRPIVALSAHAMKQDRDRSMEAGCNDHLTKPVQRDTLIRKIELVLQENETK
jgi:signal transduction histidine kinase/ActR/RegA family two-component response regulator